MDKKTLYTAIKPTGIMTLGNFIGVGKNLKNYQDDYNAIFCVADLHALTINLDNKELNENIYKILAFYLAIGVNPDKSILYVQSQVSAHSQMAWVMSNFTMFGEASRMTQFKDYQKNLREINCGLFEYPILMAGDILLYNVDIVPVGIDQKQHVELARNIAIRFNNKEKESFIVPEILMNKEGFKICGLLMPDKKMSKSAFNDTGTIFIEDSDDVIRKKIRSAVTDSENKIYYSEKKPGISNLLTIYSSLTNKTISQAEKEFENENYGVFKNKVAESIISTLGVVRDIYFELLLDKENLRNIMKKGREKAQILADKKLKEIYETLGLVVL